MIEHVDGDVSERDPGQKDATGKVADEMGQPQASKARKPKGSPEAEREGMPVQSAVSERVVTEKLSVHVVSVGPGLYDHHDQTLTTAAVVRMHDTSDGWSRDVTVWVSLRGFVGLGL